MKKLISIIFLLFSVNQLYAQDLHPIFKEAFKHVNIYNYHNKTDLEERIDTSIKLKKNTKKQYLKISEALLTNNFKFNNVNDTLLICTSHSNGTKFNLPSIILARSSKSTKFLYERYSKKSKYNKTYYSFYKERYNYSYSLCSDRTNAYALSIFNKDIDPKKYIENYFNIVISEYPKKNIDDFFIEETIDAFNMYYPKYVDTKQERYLKNSSGNYPKNLYYMIYKGDVDAFRELYKNEISIVYGGYDRVIRIVIKDGKVVSPTMIWSY